MHGYSLILIPDYYLIGYSVFPYNFALYMLIVFNEVFFIITLDMVPVIQ